MIEQGLYFGLGFAVAGLLALGFLPVLWARAIRLTRQRLQVQIPVTMQEILADRDHLRADLAVERRALEQEMERVRAVQARAMADLGRRTVEVVNLTGELAQVRAAERAQDERLTALLRENVEHEAQRGALSLALHDAHEHFEQRLGELQTLQSAHRELQAGIEERRTTIAGLSTRAMGLEMTIQDASRAREAMERQWESSKQDLLRLTQECDRLAAALATYEAPRPAGGEQGELDQARARIAALEEELAVAGRAAQEAREREKGVHLQRSLRQEKARGAGQAEFGRLDGLETENATLRDALDAARRGTGDEAAGEGDAALRASIHDIGLAVARLTLAAKEAEQRFPPAMAALSVADAPKGGLPKSGLPKTSSLPAV